ncbi:MAG: MATE family efflux transporter, partial [Nitrospira sp.]|nr:MATE family efflux transporter [Nitrospira sp.]
MKQVVRDVRAATNNRLPRHVLLFGLPLVLGLACHALFGLVDTILVGQLGGEIGAASIAIAGLCDPVSTLQTIIFNGPVAGAGVLIAASKGRDDDEGLRRTVLRATGFVLLLSAITSIPGYIFAGGIASAM